MYNQDDDSERRTISKRYVHNEEEEDEEDEPVLIKPINNFSTILAEDKDIDEPLEQQQITNVLLLNQGLDAQPFPNKQEELSEATEMPDMFASTTSECQEALNALKTDPWDNNAWQNLIEEVEKGHGGNLTIPDVFERMLVHFPKSAKCWENYSEYYIGQGDTTMAEEILKKAAPECWNLGVWNKYLNMLSTKFRELLSSKTSAEVYQKEKLNCENMFNIAVSCVGWAIDSYLLWKNYIDFVNSWPENEAMEAARKITTVRKVFQKALAIPIDQADNLWKEYETFERARNDTNMETLLQDTQRRFQHARSILRERRRYTHQIVFDRVATPSCNSPSEIQQLDLWNNWISYEMNRPDYLNPESFKPMMRMIYQQCLSCFYFHPEVWIAFARFEQIHEDVTSARVLLHKAITANPKVTLLRIALAELEEENGDINESKEIVRTMFEEIPSGYTFSIYQRLIRRNVGQTAARKLFHETLSIRANDPQLAIELYLAHATLELEVNIQPVIALQVLRACSMVFPNCIQSMHFLKLLVRILVQIGDKNQMRLTLQRAIDFAHNEEEDLEDVDPYNPDRKIFKTVEPKQQQGKSAISKISKNNNYSESKVRKLLQLLDLHINAEITLGSSDLKILQKLRTEKSILRNQIADYDRSKSDYIVRDDSKQQYKRGLYDSVVDLLDKYECCIVISLPEYDQELRERSRKTSVDMPSRSSTRKEYENGLSNLGLPSLLRDFIGKLPLALGPPQVVDIDNFVRHLKNVTLPPRPMVIYDEPQENDVVNTNSTGANEKIYNEFGETEFGEEDEVEGDDRQDILRQRKQRSLV